jgi:hypothetical protein
MENKAKILVGFLVTAIAVDISAADPEPLDIAVSIAGGGTFIYIGFCDAPEGNPKQQAQQAAFRLMALQMGKEKFAEHQLPEDPMREALVFHNCEILIQARQNQQAAAANKPEQAKKEQ